MKTKILTAIALFLSLTNLVYADCPINNPIHVIIKKDISNCNIQSQQVTADSIKITNSKIIAALVTLGGTIADNLEIFSDRTKLNYATLNKTKIIAASELKMVGGSATGGFFNSNNLILDNAQLDNLHMLTIDLSAYNRTKINSGGLMAMHLKLDNSHLKDVRVSGTIFCAKSLSTWQNSFIMGVSTNLSYQQLMVGGAKPKSFFLEFNDQTACW
ncbi:MAG TPA: hypothetical protein VHZ76_00025 [Gammaproteobacteria bacterium]|jgi:hypothetical protein|nr:hypothetical protein [Gammaproteobacteria bacterium]